MKFFKCSLLALAVLALASCASWVSHHSSTQAASIVDYLYPNVKAPPAMQASVTSLRLPVRVGIAFVPGGRWGDGPSEAEKNKLLERVKSSFSRHAYIGGIELIPTQYLRPQGGFTNLDQVARMFNVEVVALLSYDQVQFNDSGALSMLYWTIIGAYVIKGDKYDVQTMVDASVFDVSSRKLLFRAPGTSQVKGNATMANFSEQARLAQVDGYNRAVDQLIPQLQTELDGFRERIKTDAAFKVEHKAGYAGGGSFGYLAVLMALVLVALGYGKRRAA